MKLPNIYNKNINMDKHFDFIEEIRFDSLKEQIRDKQIEQESTDNTQTDKINKLESRISILEEKLLIIESKEILNKIDELQDGQSLNLKLSSNMILTDKSISIKPNTNVTIDLNEKSINVLEPNVDGIIIENGGNLTINGNGNVETLDGGNGYPIIANGNLIINNGYFKSNRDENGQANACIYARNGGNIEIYGGRFETFDGTFVLNQKDSDRNTSSIKAMGGEYVNFDPSDNLSEGIGTNFVPSGYKVESFVEGDKTIYKVIAE